MAKRNPAATIDLVSEKYGGEDYEYYPLGKYVVAAPGVCGGRPTIKYRRLDARYVAGQVAEGNSPEQVAESYQIPVAAVREAVELSRVFDFEKSYA